MLSSSSYDPPWLFKSGHLQTVYASAFRTIDNVTYQRERIETPDDDFLDVDWLKSGAGRLVILSHGLEGSSQRSYIRGMARALQRHGWDVLAWNYRGCSGEPNWQLRSYHSGATDDLDVVVQHVLRHHDYAELALVGFSLGGNITLKYLGERGDRLDERIWGATVFSVPCDLAASSACLESRSTWLYRVRFLRDLREKMRQKNVRFPDRIDESNLAQISTLRHFDDKYTAPIHGFADAADYYARCSSIHFLAAICIPTLIVNAADDPFLGETCYPIEAVRNHPYVHLRIPPYGGHVGFVAFNLEGAYWSEQQATQFLEEGLRTP